MQTQARTTVGLTQLADHTQAPKLADTFKVVTKIQPKYTWLDHLAGVFCINIHKHKKMEEKEEYVQPDIVLGSSGDDLPNPFIRPVYVQSTRKNTSRSHALSMPAKCTIDSGNMQGNIVSRHFVLDILEFSEANFCELTEEEKQGGRTVTGELFVPEGAIYLDWYHENSTRVFRSMRFLVSPHAHCDLIIGARSIIKDKLLGVPNFNVGGVTVYTPPAADRKKHTEERMTLLATWRKLNNDVKNDISRIRKLKEALKVEDDEVKKEEIETLEKRLIEPKKELLITTKTIEVYDAKHLIHPNVTAANKDKIVDELETELEGMDGYKGTKRVKQVPNGTGSSSVDTKKPEAKKAMPTRQKPRTGAL
ncbi:hypothetical protein IFR04_005875 [Cadophora malorum]|uniref:Uncharacterized protein n=1 Tax=Cadophora malorum TaxID=108018 RepID=A0A8H7TKD8_9HELO|nr:hypothetical protein IFR04_005875 [Cadophora malorum]